MAELSIDDYIAHLTSPDPDVRRYAAWVLGRQRDPRIVVPLIRALADPDGDVRARAAESLGNFRDSEIVTPLIQALEDGDVKVRVQAIESLGRQGDVRAVEPVIACLRDPESSARAAAVSSLGVLGDPRAVLPLVETLLRDGDENVCYDAARSLQLFPQAAATLIAHLPDQPAPSVKRHGAEIFAASGDRQAAAILREWATDEDDMVRETALWALEQLERE